MLFLDRAFCRAALLAVFCVAIPSAEAQVWNLNSDFGSGMNSAGSPWVIGEYSGGVVTPYQYNDTGSISSGNASTTFDLWGDAQQTSDLTGGFVWKNTGSTQAYDILPGTVSLESDNGTPSVTWVAPTSGYYDVQTAIGGSTSADAFGTGNKNALSSVFLEGNTALSGTADLATNTESWSLTDVYLAQGTDLTLYVPQNYGSGNTDAASFNIQAVPEPFTMVLGIAGVGLAVRRRARRTA